MSSSLAWSECALDVSTCLAPTHHVYSVNLQRYLLPVEHLSLQGVWATDSENLEAFEKMVANDKLARDLAGNGMSGTVVQAAILSCFITCNAWRELHLDESAKVKNTSADEDAAEQRQIETQNVVCESNPCGTKRKKPAQSSSHELSCNVPTHRLRKKTTLKVDTKQARKTKSYKSVKAEIGSHTSGNKQGTGKKPMVSIFEKEAILEAWDAAQASGDPEAKQRVMEMRGYFRGCHFDSKWGGIRRSQQWSVFVKSAPKLMKRFKELPNVFRSIISFPTMKNSSRGKEYETGSGGYVNFFLPTVLQTMVEDQIVERIDLGEQVTVTYAKNVLLNAATLWNKVVAQIQDSLPERCLNLLKQSDDRLVTLDDDAIEKEVKAMVKRVQNYVQPVRVTESDNAWMYLDTYDYIHFLLLRIRFDIHFDF